MTNIDIIIEKTIKEFVDGNILFEEDRHREGYYKDYAKKTGKKDRHSPDYYKKYRERKKQEQQTSEPEVKQTENNSQQEPITTTPPQMKRRKQYSLNKKANVGDNIVCPICKKQFVKKHYQQAFCSNDCKNDYWNAKKDRHKPGYQKNYNIKHPERLERIGIHRDYNGDFGYYDEYGDFRTYKQDQEDYDMCENPILGI